LPAYPVEYGEFGRNCSTHKEEQPLRGEYGIRFLCEPASSEIGRRFLLPPSDLKLSAKLFQREDELLRDQRMDTPHKNVRTTYPTALKLGQKRVHIREVGPWLAFPDNVERPECGTPRIVDRGFQKEALFEAESVVTHALRPIFEEQKLAFAGFATFRGG
jgi:hypothetical protein